MTVDEYWRYLGSHLLRRVTSNFISNYNLCRRHNRLQYIYLCSVSIDNNSLQSGHVQNCSVGRVVKCFVYGCCTKGDSRPGCQQTSLMFIMVDCLMLMFGAINKGYRSD